MADKQETTTIKMNKKGVGARPWIIHLIVIGLFAFLMISFAVSFMTQNKGSNLNADSNLIQAQNSLNSSLNHFSTAGQNFYDALNKNNKPDPLQIFLILPGIINTMIGMISLPWTTTQALFSLTAGEMPSPALTIVLVTLTGIIFITIVFLVYKVIRTGEGER